jgi:hypothetical protein
MVRPLHKDNAGQRAKGNQRTNSSQSLAMKTIFITNGILVLLLACSSSASAQMPSYSSSMSPASNQSIAVLPSTYQPWQYGGNYAIGTAAGSYLNGLANLTSAEGYYNYLSSLGLINLEEARARSLENDLRGTEVYFDMRRINRAAVAAETRPRLTEEQVRQMAKAQAPKRLTARQMEPVLKTLAWPAALRGDELAAQREHLQTLFAARNAADGVGSANYHEVVNATAEMREFLKGQINELNTSEYIAARKFLDSLAYEAKFAPGIEGVASK